MFEVNAQDFSHVPVMWKPKENSGKNMKQFMKRIRDKYNVEINDYQDLYKWSIDNMEYFWAELWDVSGIICSKRFNKVIDPKTPINEYQDWFSGARMNYAENLLKYRDDQVALISAGEDKETEIVTYAEMYEEVKLYTAALRKHGVTKNDKISCFMSNRKEAIYAMLGTLSIGAIWQGALPLMGAQAVLNRFKQTQPKILFTVDRFRHDHEEKDMLLKLSEISKNLLSLQKIVIVASKPESKFKDISHIKNSCFLDEFLISGKCADGSVPDILFEQVPFTHPVSISYTSGTSGLPKALIHGSCGLLSVYLDYMLHNSADRDDCWLSMSPAGWASWNLMNSMLFMGLRIVLFEGLPFFVTPTYLWDMVDEFKISNLLLTPATLEELNRRGYYPTESNNLESLKLIICGGSFVKPVLYDIFYNKIKKDVKFSSVYGSTEMMGSCSIICDETMKIHRGEAPVFALGFDHQVVNEKGEPVVGTAGELIISSPNPNMPIGLVGDTDRSLFNKAYCSQFPGKFSVGDLCVINPITKGIIVIGRSDETLKPKGCRFGSSEIYNIVNTFVEVDDSVCVSQYNETGDERAVLFIKMKDGHPFTDDLTGKIRGAIRNELSYRHVPEIILETKGIPFNMNAKKTEVIVKKIINKMPFNSETIINPESLKFYMDIPELQDY